MSITTTLSGETSTQAKTLAHVLLITEQILSFARGDDWGSDTELEEQRREALADCFSDPIPQAQSNIFSEALAAMLHMNEELISMLEAAKAEVAVKRTDQRHTSKSLGHYLDVENEH